MARAGTITTPQCSAFDNDVTKVSQNQLEHSATSLSKALHYGVEKYPAIVFDGELVVYGLTDLTLALTQYRRWQSGEAL